MTTAKKKKPAAKKAAPKKPKEVIEFIDDEFVIEVELEEEEPDQVLSEKELSERPVPEAEWKVGDIKSIHDLATEVKVDIIDDDGSVRSETHLCDGPKYRIFENALITGREHARIFFDNEFDRSTLVRKDPEEN